MSEVDVTVTRLETDLPLADRTARVAALFRERAGDAETQRTMPAEVVEAAKADGLFRLAASRSLGGAALDPCRIVATVEELSRADGSAGWTVLIGNSTAFFAWLRPDVCRAMLGPTS